MAEKWEEGTPVIVIRQGVELEGFVNMIDKKAGLLHIHTDRGPVTVINGSKLVRRVEAEKSEKPEKL